MPLMVVTVAPVVLSVAICLLPCAVGFLDVMCLRKVLNLMCSLLDW